ncbi:unnamed protein product [Symbiodinium sp. CCMP2592]|nr:unnamed protein product [Symbiodinium sp. CCMP2592]
MTGTLRCPSKAERPAYQRGTSPTALTSTMVDWTPRSPCRLVVVRDFDYDLQVARPGGRDLFV